MKVKELLKLLANAANKYPDFLEWEVALEQHEGNYEDCPNCKNSGVLTGSGYDKWLFIKSHCQGCCTYFEGKKILGLQIHY